VGLLVADLKSLSPRYEHVRKSGLSKSRARNPAETGRAGEEETEGGGGATYSILAESDSDAFSARCL